jgi:hypothetical protein
MSKTAAVRAAIAEGVDKPADGVSYVKEKFGVDITAQYFSIIKSQVKKKGPSPRVRKTASGTTGVGNGKAVGTAADLARQVKTLVEAYGADAVKGMAEVFAD